MPNPLIRKLEQRDRLSDEEKRVLDSAIDRVKNFPADEDIVQEGDRPGESCLILEGYACRYTLLADGRRQITAIHVPGDFIDLHSFPLKVMDHSVGTMTPCRVALVPHDHLRSITEKYPHLTRLLWLSTLIDAAIHREWMTGMGRRSAVGQMAHLLCELYLRLKSVGLATGFSYWLPITQAEMGDALGLSSVHVNRVVQELRAAGIITWRDETLIIDDWDRLAHIAEFDPGYLHLNVEPR